MAKKYFKNYRIELAYDFFFSNIQVEKWEDIHNVLDITSGENLPKHKMIDGQFSVYGGGGKTNNTHVTFNIDYETIGIGRVGARCGCVFKIQEKSWVTDNALLVKKFDDRFDLNFLKHYLSYRNLGQFANSAMQPVISKSRIANIKLPVIEVSEQIEIARELDYIELNQDVSRVSKKGLLNKIGIVDNWEILNTEIEFQKDLIANLKQSILQDAIQGELTKDWRKENPDVEPASELLKRIKAEKAQLVKEKKIKKEKPLPAITEEEIPFELPEGWGWVKLGNLCSKTGSGKTPRGGQSVYSSEGVKFIRSQNVYDEGLVLNGVAYISETIHLDMKSSEVQPEDLLLNITGGSIGRCCIVPKDLDTANVNQHVAIIRPVILETSYFIHNVILSPYFQSEIIRSQTGAGREGLPKNKMDNILIPFPPLEEQKAIVQKIESFMQKCTALEQEVAKSESNAEMLMQAVLKDAFEKKEEKEVEADSYE